MGFPKPLPITYDARSINLASIDDSNYYLDEMATENIKHYVSIKHTKVPAGASGASHLLRYDVEHYNVDSVLTHTVSTWIVSKAQTGVQVGADNELATKALVTLMSTTNVDSLINYEI